MYKEAVLQEIMKFHDPELPKVEGSMVSEIWEDGEHTSTKCGSIFRQRNLHCLKPGMQKNPEVIQYFRDNLPNKLTNHSSAFVPYTQADRLAALIDNAI